MEMEGKRSEMRGKREGWREIGGGERTPFLDLAPILSLEGQRTRVVEESMTLWKKSAAVSLSFLPAGTTEEDGGVVNILATTTENMRAVTPYPSQFIQAHQCVPLHGGSCGWSNKEWNYVTTDPPSHKK